jgi:methylase of polypeptide subunit release factors
MNLINECGRLYVEAPYDFRDLPYRDADFDGVVFDPPYVHNPGRLMVDRNYRNAETTKGLSHEGIIELYRQGMREAVRILRRGGLLLVKCKDEIESGKERRSHIEIYNIAVYELGLTDEGLFALTPKVNPVVQVKQQRHPRKNHSNLWVFRK